MASEQCVMIVCWWMRNLLAMSGQSEALLGGQGMHAWKICCLPRHRAADATSLVHAVRGDPPRVATGTLWTRSRDVLPGIAWW